MAMINEPPCSSDSLITLLLLRYYACIIILLTIDVIITMLVLYFRFMLDVIRSYILPGVPPGSSLRESVFSLIRERINK